MSRSLKVHPNHISNVRIALSRNGYPTQKSLANDVGLSPDTVNKFLNGKQVLHGTFEEICHRLNLDWKEISTLRFEQTSPKENINTQKKFKNQYQNWGTAPDVSVFYSRTEEIATLEQWMFQDNCRLITLFGMGGVGKTTLVTKVAQQNQAKFDWVIWRSATGLRRTPCDVVSSDELIADLLAVLSNQQETKPDINRLVDYLRNSKCLIILDNLETVLDISYNNKNFANYQGYKQLIRVIGETDHQSCIILTTRYKTVEMNIMQGAHQRVRSLKLFGDIKIAFPIIKSYQLLGTSKQKQQLCNRYSNNPLNIQIVANTIVEFFNGNIKQFISENILILGGIHSLLDEQFQHLSKLEWEIIYWLKINPNLTNLTYLQKKIVSTQSKVKILDSLDNLMRRSLIEKTAGSYTQSPIVMEYVEEVLAEKVVVEISAK